MEYSYQNKPITVEDIIKLSIFIFYVMFICGLIIHLIFQNIYEKIEKQNETLEKLKKEIEKQPKEEIEEYSETNTNEQYNVEQIIELLNKSTKKEKRIIKSCLELAILDYTTDKEELKELNDSNYKHKINGLGKIILLLNFVLENIQKKD